MDFGNTPTTKTTERIMAEIREHLKDDQPGHPTHYNAVYSTIHRNLLASVLVARLPTERAK